MCDNWMVSFSVKLLVRSGYLFLVGIYFLIHIWGWVKKFFSLFNDWISEIFIKKNCLRGAIPRHINNDRSLQMDSNLILNFYFSISVWWLKRLIASFLNTIRELLRDNVFQITITNNSTMFSLVYTANSKKVVLCKHYTLNSKRGKHNMGTSFNQFRNRIAVGPISRHLLIPWSGGAFAPLGPFLCPTTEEKKWPIAPKPGP